MFDSTEQEVLREFFKYPTTKLQLRQIAREIDVSHPTVKRHVEELVEKDLVENVDEGTFPGYRAKRSQRFELYKKIHTEIQLHESGLVDELERKIRPDALVLFGSAARGEDIEKSDIDILALAGPKEVDLEGYEKLFNRNIEVQFMTQEELERSSEFKNNMANGVVLSGYLVVE